MPNPDFAPIPADLLAKCEIDLTEEEPRWMRMNSDFINEIMSKLTWSEIYLFIHVYISHEMATKVCDLWEECHDIKIVRRVVAQLIISKYPESDFITAVINPKLYNRIDVQCWLADRSGEEGRLESEKGMILAHILNVHFLKPKDLGVIGLINKLDDLKKQNSKPKGPTGPIGPMGPLGPFTQLSGTGITKGIKADDVPVSEDDIEVVEMLTTAKIRLTRKKGASEYDFIELKFGNTTLKFKPTDIEVFVEGKGEATT